MKQNWWKIVASIFLIYSLVAGFLLPIPELDILEQSIRNLFFHVPMWFSMMAMMFISLWYSIKYLNSNKTIYDIKASAFAQVGFVLGLLGITTGSVWAKVTWGAWWVFSEPKLNGAAAALLVYAAYFILRSSFDDEEKTARFSAVYNLFAFVMFMVFINILPRLTDSLHPGNGGNPGFNAYDLDSRLRAVFYPACIGWIVIAYWIGNIVVRIKQLNRKILMLEID